LRHAAASGIPAARPEENMNAIFRVSALLAASLLVAPKPAFAADTNTPSSPPQSQSQKPVDSKKKKPASKKQDKKSEQQFIDGYKAAHAMIYQSNDFAGGIAKLRSLNQDNHPDVANLIGFSSRKLGRYDDAKLWYEKALAANPDHTLTWSYYGMWHAEQGNLLKAREHLTKVASICGTDCREYVMLKEVIEGTRAY
jgi:tetratricopeptide (TPR) repeat protein